MSIGKAKINPQQSIRDVLGQRNPETYTNAELLLPEIFDTQEHGSVVYLHGGKGTGKTHEAVNIAYWLVNECDYAVITNIQFIDSNGEQKYPDGVYFADDFAEYWKAMADIREKDPQKPVTVIIDEFHKTCMRLASTKVEVRMMYKWLSEIRKYISSALMITQNTEALPSKLLWWTNWFLIKDSEMTSTYNSEFNTRFHPRKLTFMLPVRNYKVYYYIEGFGHWASKVEKYEQDEVSLGSVDDVCYSGITPWTDTNDKSCPSYSTHGSAMWEMGEVGGEDAKNWMPKLMKKLGRTVPKRMSDAICEFFEEVEDGGVDKVDGHELEPHHVAKWIKDKHTGDVVELSDTGNRKRNINISYGNLAKIVGLKQKDKARLYQKMKRLDES